MNKSGGNKLIVKNIKQEAKSNRIICHFKINLILLFSLT